jgi:hypothetical protein
MKRTTRLIVSTVALAATVTGVAAAASSPTVATGGATKITHFAATLNATVNPNGNETGYVFQYGVTSAYGQSTNSHSAGGGTAPVKVADGISGLTPGTVYHYRVAALNRTGGALGADHTFRTIGPPPALVATGAAVNVTSSTATVTGSVTTNGAATEWVVQYGVTTAYGAQTFGQVVANSPTAVPVSVTLTGLAPATLFHYRLVGYHGSSVVSYGGDGTFFTEPLQRPKPRLSAHTKPSVARHRPYAFTTVGSLGGAMSIPPFARCAGNVGVRYYRGRQQIGFVVVPVGSNCQFMAQASFRHVRGVGPTPVRIRVDFRGNGYVAPASHTDHVIVR